MTCEVSNRLSFSEGATRKAECACKLRVAVRRFSEALLVGTLSVLDFVNANASFEVLVTIEVQILSNFALRRNLVIG